jgi:hypothetical protein
MAITLRLIKGSALTFQELDNNFITLDNKTTVTNRDPDANDDELDNHQIGDLWINNLTKEFFECTDNLTISAVWNSLGILGDDTTSLKIANNLTDVSDRQVALNNLTDVTTATNEYALVKDTATGNAIWKEVTIEPPTIGQNNTFRADTKTSSATGSAVYGLKNDGYGSFTEANFDFANSQITLESGEGANFNIGDTVSYVYSYQGGNNQVHQTTIIAKSGDLLTLDTVEDIVEFFYATIYNDGTNDLAVLKNESKTGNNLNQQLSGSQVISASKNTYIQGRNLFIDGDSNNSILKGIRAYLLRSDDCNIENVGAGSPTYLRDCSNIFGKMQGVELTNSSNCIIIGGNFIADDLFSVVALGFGTNVLSDTGFVVGNGGNPNHIEVKKDGSIITEAKKTQTITTTTTLTSSQGKYWVDTSLGDVEITLPAPLDYMEILISKRTSDGNKVKILPNTTETINGYTSIEITQNNSSLTIVSDGINYGIS